MNILFIASEAYPFIKTGGLADVAGSLPRALLKRKHSVRLVLPAYSQVLAAAEEQGLKSLGELTLGEQTVSLWQTRLPGTRVPVWLVDIPEFSERQGNPYLDEEGKDWPDNNRRFYRFCQAAVELAMGRAGTDWQADLVHANDWQAGMACMLLSQEAQRPASVFTVHNLAYHGLFPAHSMAELNLPGHLWHHELLEFHNQLSFIKGGLVFADQITTVSPSYAREIQTTEFGCGLDGLLRARQGQLSGVLNGIDTDQWHPGRDPNLAQNYNWRQLNRKAANKQALQKKLGLPEQTDKPLLGFIGRMVEQKGLDLILALLPKLLAEGQCQFALLGSGMARYQDTLKQLASQYPEHMALTLGYNEPLAHQIEAGCDLFLMPSLFEPCGLNQMYSLRYGTLPLVHAVGGLKDTVFDPGPLPETEELPEQANGFSFQAPGAAAMQEALERAFSYYRQPKLWRQLQTNAMRGDYSWERSAGDYEQIYQKAIDSRH